MPTGSSPQQQPTSGVTLQQVLETQQSLAKGVEELARNTRQLLDTVARIGAASRSYDSVTLGLLMLFCEAGTQWQREQIMGHLSSMIAQGQVDTFLNHVAGQGQQGKG
jgi:hypothetical protein